MSGSREEVHCPACMGEYLDRERGTSLAALVSCPGVVVSESELIAVAARDLLARVREVKAAAGALARIRQLCVDDGHAAEIWRLTLELERKIAELG